MRRPDRALPSVILDAIRASAPPPEPAFNALVTGFGEADAAEQAAFLDTLAVALDRSCEHTVRHERQLCAVAEALGANGPGRAMVLALAAYIDGSAS